MSVTFWPEKAPSWIQIRRYDDYGIVDVSEYSVTAGEINFSNANALDVSDLLGLGISPDEMCGCLDWEDLPYIREACLKFIESPLFRYNAHRARVLAVLDLVEMTLSNAWGDILYMVGSD